MFKEFGSTREVFINQDEGMFVAMPITLDENTFTLETETVGARKYVKAGSVVKEGSVVRGILAEKYDITDGPAPARVVLEGYAWAERLTAEAILAASSLPRIVIMPYKTIAVTASAFATTAGGGMTPETKAILEANQALIESVEVGNSVITIKVPVDALGDYVSTDQQQALLGEVNWIGILIHTHVGDITGLTYNGGALTAGDVSDAADVGGGAGDICLWIVADTVKVTPKVITLAGNGYAPIVITVKVEG